MHFYFTGSHGFEFFERLKLVQRLGQPFSDAIHQLEADKPLLSQVLPIFETLVHEARIWVASLPEVGLSLLHNFRTLQLV
jgi:hypothetical protein